MRYSCQIKWVEKVFVMLAVMLISQPAIAQKSKADKLFESKQYHAAIQIYEGLTDKAKEPDRSDMILKTGLAYLNINQPQKALPYLGEITDSGKANGNGWYQYGLALQLTGSYREAIAAFEQCLKIQPGHQFAASKITSCRFALQNNQINPYTNYRLATEVNTAGSEFGISLYANNMIYYSVAGIVSDNSKVDTRTGLQFVEPYMARLHNKRLINPQYADNALPRFVTDGLFTYDSIAQCVYFSYCNPENNRCGLYACQLKNNKWSRPEMILQNKKDQSTGHPAIANNGSRLYFTSNSTDGIGQTDIWYIDRVSSGKWGEPVNAGSMINTPGREEFPFVYADSLLFFASDGHTGYGGLDIFCSVIRNNVFSQPVNLRRPYNSSGDDFNLVLSGNMGMMSSCRNELVSDDIYMFEGIPSLLYLSGKVTDTNTGKAVDQARLTLSVEGKAVQHTISDSTGYYGFFLKGDDSPMIFVRATGYKPSLSDVKSYRAEQFSELQRDIKIQPSDIQPVIVTLYDQSTGTPVAERGLICYNDDGETQIIRTDRSGKFQLVVQEGQKEYWIKFPDGYYLTESVILNDEQKSYSLQVQPLSRELFSGWLRFKANSVEPIEMSQPLIPRIAAIIRENPGIIFQVTGFGEPGQSALADQRARYMVRRLEEEGVNSRQLTIAAGKSRTNNQPLSEEEKAALRKVEIRVKR